VVGDRQAFHAISSRFFVQCGDGSSAVKQGELGVAVEVRKHERIADWGLRIGDLGRWRVFFRGFCEFCGNFSIANLKQSVVQFSLFTKTF
jgi:hypothetical protein